MKRFDGIIIDGVIYKAVRSRQRRRGNLNGDTSVGDCDMCAFSVMEKYESPSGIKYMVPFCNIKNRVLKHFDEYGGEDNAPCNCFNCNFFEKIKGGEK